MSNDREKLEFMCAAGVLYDELRAWRAAHPDATFDEIASQVTPKRRELMGELLGQLAQQGGDGRYEEVICAECGVPMQSSGRRKRRIVHAEGEVEMTRAYHHCPACGSGLFPPGPAVEVDPTESDTQDG